MDFLAFHVEHIIAEQHGGGDDLSNLCLACPECNLSKGPNLSGFLAGKIMPLFNPRRQSWKRHFEWDGPVLMGRTQIGKVTVMVLNINAHKRVRVRQSLIDEGRFPPDGA
ncbi:MAG: HNH endonuclease [Planctomycetes bacterium]|nr:HNH endonuclease [Planctomycetota bacterium]